MIYIDTGSSDVYFNFGLEYYLSTEKHFDDTVFLFWRTTPTLMVGKYQNTLEEINKPYADAHGINIVRRMSGGGTIYTDLGGWQFTFIHPKNSDEIEFKRYIEPVIAALAEFGVAASFNGRNDLTIGGKKFSGNAQFRLGDYVIHHGSLLYSTDIEQMVNSTTVDQYKIISKSIRSVRDRVTNISEHMAHPIDPEAFRESTVKHIIGEDGTFYTLTEDDKTRIRELALEKFNNWQSIFGRNPKFNIDRTGRFEGGKIQFKLDVNKGIITDAGVYGDFFSTLDSETIEKALIGVKYDKSSVRQALKDASVDGAIYKITLNELVDTITD